jgi:hypothetical protein
MVQNLKKMAQDLKVWSSANFGNVTRKIEELRRELQQLEHADPVYRRVEIKNIQYQLDELLYREEIMWLQRSRIAWLKEGDRNTRYFHRKARWRAKKNWVRRLEREDGSWCSAQPEMMEMTQTFFSNLFTADQTVVPDEIVNLFEQKVSDDTNQNLCRDFSEDEIGGCIIPDRATQSTWSGWLPCKIFAA